MIRLLLKTTRFNEIEEACSLGRRVTEIFVQHRQILYSKLEAQADEVIAQQYSNFNAIDGRTKITKGQAETATQWLLQEVQDWPEDTRITVTQLLSMYLILNQHRKRVEKEQRITRYQRKGMLSSMWSTTQFRRLSSLWKACLFRIYRQTPGEISRKTNSWRRQRKENEG